MDEISNWSDTERPRRSAAARSTAWPWVVGAAVTALAAVSWVGFSDSGGGQTSSLKAIARGRAWFEKLATGRAPSLQELAKREGITRRYIRRLVNLAFLSPAIQRGQTTRRAHREASELDLPDAEPRGPL
jgi:hypothetical protein